MSGELILLVDDEPNIVQLARLYLEQEDFKVDSVGDGLAALEYIDRKNPDLIVLDIMLPELDGLEVCRKLRNQDNSIPILMLTARDDDIDKILGLELGADDYLTKPFNPREMAARVKAILRRGALSESAANAPIQIVDLIIDPLRREVSVHGQIIDLRAQEFDLLYTLVQHKGLVMSRAQLLEKAWGYKYYGYSRTVDVHIGHLRKKLSTSAVKIVTVSRVGYKLVPYV
jgi:two-component system, OmpR family, alkaline phosphatase synthesis response regulator PhoP